MKKLILYFVDALIILFFSVVIFIILLGGRKFCISGSVISIHSVVNPITFFYFLVVIRLFLDKRFPFLGIKKINLNNIYNKLINFIFNFYEWLNNKPPKKIISIIVIFSLLIKLLNSYFFFGFYSGDDVEIHEMTFARLFNWDWQAWKLRSPFYPMVFIYPVQKLLFLLGVNEAFPLIFSGRFVVIIFSILNLILVYIITKQLFKSIPMGILSVFFLSISKLHTTFASSVLPRTVASTFVLLCVWFLICRKRKFLIIAAILLAIGASIRFSGVIFIVPAFFYLILEKRVRQAFLFSIIFFIAFTFIIGCSDLLYWGKPLFSLINIVDYTLVNKLSSRGYQPIYYYFSNFGEWTNIFILILAFYAVIIKPKKLYIWAFAPIFILSFLPHKEPRYLVPIIPFILILASFSYWNLIKKLYKEKNFNINFPFPTIKSVYILIIILIGFLFLSHKDPIYSIVVILISLIISLIYFLTLFIMRNRKNLKHTHRIDAKDVSIVIALFFIGVFIFEVSTLRFPRSESGVRSAYKLAYFIKQKNITENIIVEHNSRCGGRLYFNKLEKLKYIEPYQVKNKKYLLSYIKNKNIKWLALTTYSLKNNKIDLILYNKGWKEVDLPNKVYRSKYRLFKREIKSKK